MLEKRKILVILLGIIIGIIMGLYCKISIVLFYAILILIYIIFKKEKKKEFKLISIRRYSRYLKIVFTKSVIKTIIIFSIISNTIILYQENKFQNLYKDLENQACTLTGIIVSVENTKNRIKIKIIDEKYKNSYLYVYFNDEILEYGDKIEIKGVFYYPSHATNYGEFDYANYLKTLKIYGIVKAENIKVISKNNVKISLKYINKLKNFLEKRIENSILSDEEKAIFNGILLGNKSDIEEELQNNFSKSNILHVLVASGMHVSYIALISDFIFSKIIGKHGSKVFCSLVIIIYIGIVGFTPSILRAGIAGIIAIFSNFFYRKNDTFTALSISFLVILFYNPYLITSIGVLLSFAGTIGIIVISKIISKLVNNSLERKKREAIRRNQIGKIKYIKVLENKPTKIIMDTIIVTISASLTVFPIILVSYNIINISSIFISIATSFLICPIIFLGIFFLIFNFKIIQILLSCFLKILIYSAKLGSVLPFNQIYFITPNIFQIIIYYICLFFIFFIININLEKKKNIFYKRMVSLLNLFKYRLKSNKEKIISISLVIILIYGVIIIIPKNLKIYFVDVGQGDCTLIVTPKNNKILLDGGGNEWGSTNIGEETLMPYLLDRGILSLDYVLISHFDTDHVQGILYIMENMNVKNAIISKQAETSENFEDFIKIINEKNINLIIVNKGDKINVEKNVYFQILWPDSSNFLNENALNNNSILCKLCFKNFSCMFTGDIEELAENEIIKLYSNTNLLNSTILKVAHHGSKTSTTDGFLELVKPKIALIGVGKNNLYGHPNSEVIERLEKIGCKIYRTDEDGEIKIEVNYITQTVSSNIR